MAAMCIWLGDYDQRRLAGRCTSRISSDRLGHRVAQRRARPSSRRSADPAGIAAAAPPRAELWRAASSTTTTTAGGACFIANGPRYTKGCRARHARGGTTSRSTRCSTTRPSASSSEAAKTSAGGGALPNAEARTRGAAFADFDNDGQCRHRRGEQRRRAYAAAKYPWHGQSLSNAEAGWDHEPTRRRRSACDGLDRWHSAS